MWLISFTCGSETRSPLPIKLGLEQIGIGIIGILQVLLQFQTQRHLHQKPTVIILDCSKTANKHLSECAIDCSKPENKKLPECAVDCSKPENKGLEECKKNDKDNELNCDLEESKDLPECNNGSDIEDDEENDESTIVVEEENDIVGDEDENSDTEAEEGKEEKDLEEAKWIRKEAKEMLKEMKN
ncbi:hypothetical protein H8356DRAFT_1304834 [Neocallimastix lanati (nom. inval.)]|nr:hypothetical protein H8356DRAFT_1304834 [Neocallimastix sp. JGI-2020a]